MPGLQRVPGQNRDRFAKPYDRLACRVEDRHCPAQEDRRGSASMYAASPRLHPVLRFLPERAGTIRPASMQSTGRRRFPPCKHAVPMAL